VHCFNRFFSGLLGVKTSCGVKSAFGEISRLPQIVICRRKPR